MVAESVAEAIQVAQEQQESPSIIGTTVSALTTPETANLGNDASSQFSGRASQASLKKAIMEKLAKKPKSG